jgi:DNA-binding NarL/FixJ family response regulator
MTVDILLVDDHKIMRDGIKAILRHCDDFRVVAEAENGADALRLCRQQTPQMVVMEIVILSMYDDTQSVAAAIRSGAKGFVLKKASDMELVNALRTVARGNSYLSQQVADQLVSLIRTDQEPKARQTGLEALTPREMQVLRLVTDGKTSKEIAVMLDLGLQTVRSYRKTMMKKLGVSNAPELTKLALQAGINNNQPTRPQPLTISEDFE